MSGPEPFEADPALVGRLLPMLEMLQADPASLSSVTDPAQALDVHLLDSLSGTLVRELENPGRVVDIGSGAGFPGIPMAVARPQADFDLVDSVGRKTEFISRVVERLGLPNVRAVHSRSEELAASAGREVYQVATARAVAPLSALAELASPLLEPGGTLVAWKGGRDAGEEEVMDAVSRHVAMEIDRVLPVRPFATSRIRHLYVLNKTGLTPPGLPRRPGMARKRPLTG